MALSGKDFWLVVEDDDNDFLLFRRACARALSPQPTIHRESNGTSAQEYLSRGSCHPQLIISDLKMPKGDGLELLEWLRKRQEFRRIPFVMLSSSSAHTDVEQAQELGADSYRVKPTEFNQLLLLVKELATTPVCEHA
jgi:two-component system response regulator